MQYATVLATPLAAVLAVVFCDGPAPSIDTHARARTHTHTHTPQTLALPLPVSRRLPSRRLLSRCLLCLDTGAAPAVLKDYNAFRGSEAGAVLRVKNEGANWVDDQFKDVCDCGYKSLSHGILTSKSKYGEGYYEARMKTSKRSPFMAAFWLQGTKGEINVMEFVGKMRGAGDSKKFWTNFHCFDKADANGDNTISGQEFYDAPDDFHPTDFHTYGVDWQGDTLKFYADGNMIRSASASCLVGEQMTVVFSHEANPAFDGQVAGENSLTLPLTEGMLMRVTYFKYWTPFTSRSCATLGWMNSINNVCSAVKVKGECLAQVKTDLATAERTCAAQGARLCTRHELRYPWAGIADDSTSQGCSAWRKHFKVWATETTETKKCTNAGQHNILSAVGGTACVNKTEPQLGQCCFDDPIKKVCDAADTDTVALYSKTTAAGTCARTDFGFSGIKMCLYRNYVDSEQFCHASGGDLCTKGELQAGITTGMPGECGSENAWIWMKKSSDVTEDECASKNDKDAKKRYAPVTKQQGYIRKRKSGKIVRDLRCGMKGGKKLTVCCFKK